MADSQTPKHWSEMTADFMAGFAVSRAQHAHQLLNQANQEASVGDKSADHTGYITASVEALRSDIWMLMAQLAIRLPQPNYTPDIDLSKAN